MDFASFLAHFPYIILTFLSGLVLGYALKEKIEEKLNKIFAKK